MLYNETKYGEMSNIKLEVGKTYQSREGNKVRIVGRINSKTRIWPFFGDNGESYDDQGRYYSTSFNDPRDLIEEVEREGK